MGSRPGWPAARRFSADAIEVFENIDGVLLLATWLIVFVLLLAVYRSPVFWFFPLLAVIFAELASRGIGYGLTEIGVTVNGSRRASCRCSSSAPAPTTRCLLVARYREELRQHEDKHEAMAEALRRAGPAIIASGLTVIAALLCLTHRRRRGHRRARPDRGNRDRRRDGRDAHRASRLAADPPLGLDGVPRARRRRDRRRRRPSDCGPDRRDRRHRADDPLLRGHTASEGWQFWPFVPHVGDEGADETHGIWRRIGDRIAVRPRRVWAGTVAALLVLTLGWLAIDLGLTQGNQFRGDVESVQAQELLAESFPAGAGAPTEVIVPDPADVDAVSTALTDLDSIEDVRPSGEGEDGVLLLATLAQDPYSTEAFDEIEPIRDAAKAAGGEEVLVGGPTAIERDLRVASARDSILIPPIALFVVFLILVALLRAVVAPLILIGTVILSFAAALGVGYVVFDVIFGFAGSDPSLPLFAFIFLVALGSRLQHLPDGAGARGDSARAALARAPCAASP